MSKTFSKLFIFIVAVSISGCKINRMENKLREGLWVEKDTLNHMQYKSRGRYHKGFEVKTWRYYENRKLAKKEIYKDSICLVTLYFPNGKVREQGQTKLQIFETLSHWFYFGDWKVYDESGKLLEINNYAHGELMSSTEFGPDQ